MHPLALAVSLIVFFVGLAMVFFGGLLSIFFIQGLVSVGAGIDLMIAGAVVAFLAWKF